LARIHYKKFATGGHIVIHHRLLRQKAASHNKMYNKNTETN